MPTPSIPPQAMHFDTLALQVTHQTNEPTGAVVAPLYLSTTFERDAAYAPVGDHLYARTSNPTRQALEQALAALEGGAVGMAFSSGQAATMTLFQALRPGDHVVVAQDAYFGTPSLLEDVFHPWGLTYTRVDMTDHAAVQRSIHENTRVVWCETPSNPMLAMTDLLTIATMAHEVGALCVCDNTWATPVLQHPLELNCDVVMHSTTKYLSGHSDALGGALIFKRDDDFAKRVRLLQGLGGAVSSPFDCYLITRGLKTLGVRVRAQQATAQAVAEFLAAHPAVERVNYPGLPTHPGYSLMKQQMNGPGAMLSVHISTVQGKTGAAAALHVAGKLQLFTRATSMGSVESLVEHRASVEGLNSKTPPTVLRLSIGLEHAEDLIEDLKQALA